MDVAASEFHKDGKYDLDFKNPESKPEDWISSEQLCEMYKGFVQKYPVVSTQCGNFMILVLLRFYVKSTWRILEVQNQPIYLI